MTRDVREIHPAAEAFTRRTTSVWLWATNIKRTACQNR